MYWHSFLAFRLTRKLLCYVLKSQINSISKCSDLLNEKSMSLSLSLCLVPTGDSRERWIYQQIGDRAWGDASPSWSKKYCRVCPVSPPWLHSLCLEYELAEEARLYWTNESAIYILTNLATSDYKSTPMLHPAPSVIVKCKGWACLAHNICSIIRASLLYCITLMQLWQNLLYTLKCQIYFF